MLHPLTVDAPDEVLEALAEVGRIEDASFSPDGRRLALACYHHESVLVLDVELVADQPVAITSATILRSERFASPHGVAFLTADLLAVANRLGAVTLMAVPHASTVQSISAEPLLELGEPHGIESPGSVTVRPVAAGLYELLVCNNYTHRLTRHVVDAADPAAPRSVSDSVLAASGLLVPDGVTYSADGRQLIVSNHDLMTASVFDNAPGLHALTAPVGSWRGVSYPHGLQCTPDGRFALVADAGRPVVHVFASDEGGWHGEREPVASVRVVEEAAYQRSSEMVGEGGPKALSIDGEGRVVVLAGEHLPLSFYDVAAFTGGAAGRPVLAGADAADAAARLGLLREARRGDELADERDRLAARLAEREAYVGVLEQMVHGLRRRVHSAERPR